MEPITIQITAPMQYDKLRTLAAEYSVSTELLINLAVKRLLDDIELFRKLRTGEVRLE